MRRLWALARAEATELMRTPEVHAYLVVPALVLLPVLAVVVGMIVALQDQDAGALPEDFPTHFPRSALTVEEALLEEDWVLRRVADPRAALENGVVDAAVVAWEHTASGLSLTVAGPEADNLVDDFEDAEHTVLKGLVEEAGGDVDRDWRIALVERADDRRDLDIPRGVVLAYLLFLSTAIGYTLIPAALAADRQRGVLESLVATPTPRWALLGVRVTLITLLQLVTLGLHYLNVYGLFSSLFAIPLVPPPDAVLGLFVALMGFNTVFAVAGMAATNARQAYYVAAPFWAGGTVALVTAFAIDNGGTDIPAWIPLIGLVTSGDPVEHWTAVGVSALAVVVVLAVVGRLLPAAWALPGRDA